MLLVVVATLSAYIWYTPTIDYCTTLDSADPCYCPFPIWKRLVVGICLAVEAATALYMVWTVNEASGDVVRLNVYRIVLRVPLLVLYLVVAVLSLLAFVYCNGPYTPFNPCNSRDWARAQDNYTATTCDLALGFTPLAVSDLTWNPAFVAFAINSWVALLLYGLIMYVADEYKDRKLELMGHGLANTTAAGERELIFLAIATSVFVVLYAASLVVAVAYLLVSGALPTLTFDLLTVWYMIWVGLQFVLPIVLSLCIWPIVSATAKAVGNVVVAIWFIKDLFLLVAALVWYLLCYLPTLPALSLAPSLPASACAGITTPPTSLFDAINITTCVQAVLELMLAFTFSAASRRLSAIKQGL
jgi:hypothetical protein